jgi:hypothetical protein
MCRVRAFSARVLVVHKLYGANTFHYMLYKSLLQQCRCDVIVRHGFALVSVLLLLLLLVLLLLLLLLLLLPLLLLSLESFAAESSL